jgi:nucleoid DNA-binding protein
MNEEKCIQQIGEKLEIDKILSNKIYEKFWDFIFEKIASEGSAEIQGIGTFNITEKDDGKKKKYFLEFQVSNSLLSRLDIK